MRRTESRSRRAGPSAKPDTKKAAAREVRRTRKRRSPEVARREILDAAERLMADAGPDAVGLKAVASAAGVSHALVSHYFGTYDALVDAVLARKADALTEAVVARIGEAPWPGATQAKPSDSKRARGAKGRAHEGTKSTERVEGAMQILDVLFAVLTEPAYARLSTWAMLSGRGSLLERHLARFEALRRVVDALVARADEARRSKSRAADRKDIEVAVVVALAAAQGYAVGKGAYLHGLGREPSDAMDARVVRALGEMLGWWVTR
jgi:AcrR family transcriptional regulator